ncbi:MAG TPA: Uma2 family endonuclease, partial [Tepidisphaeraceae bacterium]|jgi:Uma2 family endonuclease|nr:Uma2 family endonuclease [Tepidisphaeraceae bacterium]
LELESPRRKFKVGTLGWTADDLDDPRIERLWEKGRYEIVEGVLTEMPPAQFDAGEPLIRLLSRLQTYVDRKKLGGGFAVETDIIIDQLKVAIADAVYLTADDKTRQAELYAKKPTRRPEVRFGRLLIPPTLIIEAISLGHEAHDRETKFNWYADAGVKHYWLLDTFRRSLECYTLSKTGYRLEASGSDFQKIKTPLFPGLVIPLAKLWE